MSADSCPATPIFRISKDVNDVTDVDSENQIEIAVRGIGPGRYHIDQLERDPLPSGNTSRRWGIGIKRPDGTVAIESDPWES